MGHFQPLMVMLHTQLAISCHRLKAHQHCCIRLSMAGITTHQYEDRSNLTEESQQRFRTHYQRWPKRHAKGGRALRIKANHITMALVLTPRLLPFEVN